MTRKDITGWFAHAELCAKRAKKAVAKAYSTRAWSFACREGCHRDFERGGGRVSYEPRVLHLPAVCFSA